MFYETSHEKLFFTESWPTSTTLLKRKFSKSLNSICNKKTKSNSNISNNDISLSNSCSNSLSNPLSSSHSNSSSLTDIYNSNDLMETINNSYLFASQGSILDIIEEE